MPAAGHRREGPFFVPADVTGTDYNDGRRPAVARGVPELNRPCRQVAAELQKEGIEGAAILQPRHM